MPEFMPGLTLGELLYNEAVKPILEDNFPNLKYSAALIGSGSEILGYDTAISSDHQWGPRMLLFLAPEEYEQFHANISQVLSEQLPHEFRGYSTNFGAPDATGIRVMQRVTSGSVSHLVYIKTILGFFESYLGVNPYQEITLADWLTLPDQKLLTVTGGRVYYDGLGELNPIRAKFHYYPDPIWLYMLASQWHRISQEEAFVGRTSDVGDELGSRVIATRLVRELMRLCFLMERTYAPYSKWFGTAFARLSCAERLLPAFMRVLQAGTWREREAHLSEAYRLCTEMHNALQITAPVATQVSSYHSRPYLVIHADEIAAAIRAKIADDDVKKLPLIGSVDQFIDCTDISSEPAYCRRLKIMYE